MDHISLALKPRSSPSVVGYCRLHSLNSDMAEHVKIHPMCPPKSPNLSKSASPGILCKAFWEHLQNRRTADPGRARC